MFVVEQPSFGRLSAGVSSKRSVAASDPVAGHEERQRISPHGSGHGPDRPRHAERPGQRAIGERAAVRYVEQAGPYTALEGSARGIERETP